MVELDTTTFLLIVAGVVIAALVHALVRARRRLDGIARQSASPKRTPAAAHRTDPRQAGELFYLFFWPALWWTVAISVVALVIAPNVVTAMSVLGISLVAFVVWRGLRRVADAKPEDKSLATISKASSVVAAVLAFIVTPLWYYNNPGSLAALFQGSSVTAWLAEDRPPLPPEAKVGGVGSEPYLAPIDVPYWQGTWTLSNIHMKTLQNACDPRQCFIKIAPGGRIAVSNPDSREPRDVNLVFTFHRPEGQHTRTEEDWAILLVNGKCQWDHPSYELWRNRAVQSVKSCVGNWRDRIGTFSGAYTMVWEGHHFFTVYLNPDRQAITTGAPFRVTMTRKRW